MLLVNVEVAAKEPQPRVEMTGFIKIDGVTAAEGYRRAKLWLASRVAPRDDITLDDVGENTVVGRAGADLVLSGWAARLGYSCTLTAREGGVAWRFSHYRVSQFGATTDYGSALSDSGRDRKIRAAIDGVVRDLEDELQHPR